MPYNKQRSIISAVVFLAGLASVIIAMQFSGTRQFIVSIGHDGMFGALLSGILYAFAFTSSTATIIFSNASPSFSPLLIALAGGFGAALYDITVFAFVRKQSHRGVLEMLRNRMALQHKIPRWLLLLAGLAVLASPLPDELASGLLGFTKFSMKNFIFISFLANAVGIFIIVQLSRA